MGKLRRAVVLLVGASIGAGGTSAQSNASANGPSPGAVTLDSSPTPIAAEKSVDRYLWTESFSGSSNSEATVTSLDSTVGYVFSPKLGVDAGIPIYFVRGNYVSSTGATQNTSANGFGDFYTQVRVSLPTGFLNYKTVLTGALPTGDSTTGLSTGHATYDWTNHFDRSLGHLTPFFEMGIGNSIPSALVFNRPYQTYGHEAHLHGGAVYQVADYLAVSASGYDIAPWGTQTISSRVVGPSGPRPGNGGNGHAPVFAMTNQTTGASSLADDNGFALDANLSPTPVLAFSVGYSRSLHLNLNTISFGMGVNVSRILRNARQ